MEGDPQATKLGSVVGKLIKIASKRLKPGSPSRHDSLDRLTSMHPAVAFEVVARLLEKPAPEPTMLVYQSVFLATFSSVDAAAALKVFTILQTWFLGSKTAELFSIWDRTCAAFVQSPETAAQVIASLSLNCPCALVTHFHATKFIADDILAKLAATRTNFLAVHPDLAICFIGALAEHSSHCVQFLSTAFPWVFQALIEHPSAEPLRALMKIMRTFSDLACPVHSRYYVARLCEVGTGFPVEMLPSVFEFLDFLCYDRDLVKRIVEFHVAVLRITNGDEFQPIGDRKRFPVDSIEPLPVRHNNPIFRGAISSLMSICQNFLEIVFVTLLSGPTVQSRWVGFDAATLLVKRMQFNDSQREILLKTIRWAIGRKVYEAGLSELVVELLQIFVLGEEDVAAFTSYVADAAVGMGNAHYFMQLASVNEKHQATIFKVLSELMFDESRITILSSLSQCLNLLLLRRIGDGQSYFVHESLDEAKENSVLHPFVPILVKTSIADKALYLLRVLSSLMSHGALHPFVPSMLENLRIFFDFAFPMAFSEIEGIIQSIIKCINSSSEFPSLVMSLLSNVMRLLNDRQFRISLCGAVLHEVELNIHPRHTQNCLDVFGTMVPFLPADVAAANLQKLFTILPLDSPTLSDAFAELLGSLAHQHSGLVLPFVKNWTTMKSNASFMLGKSRQPISYSFITKVLLGVAKELPTDILVKTGELFGLLVILTKRTDIHPMVLLSAMNELCSRLSFHRSTFELGQFDYLFKFLLKFIGTQKQRQHFPQCLVSLKILIQVRPCLSPTDFLLLAERVLTPQFLSLAIADAKVFTEFRGLILAILVVLPQTDILVVLMKLLMPHIENADILLLASRCLAIFESYVRQDTGTIRFFRPIKQGKIVILPRMLTDLISASDAKLGFQSAVYALKIDRTVEGDIQTIQTLLSALTPQERGNVTNVALEALAKGKNYSIILAELIAIDDRCIQPAQVEKFIADVFSKPLAACPQLIQRLLLRDDRLFFRWILNEGLTEHVLKILSVLFEDQECTEILSQQLCQALLDIPGDDLLIEKLLLFGDQILPQSASIPPVHMFQLVASLMIFGISEHEFEGLSEFFVPSMRHLAPVKKFDELRPQQERAHFHHIWEAALGKFGVSGTFGSILRKMVDTDRSFLLDVMNFLMTSCQLTKPLVSSGIAIFAGEVLMQVDVYTAEEPLFQLYFSALLSFGPMFDHLTCICCHGEMIKLLAKSTVDETTFPGQYISRILQILFKRCTEKSIDVVDSVGLCVIQFCATFKNGLNERLNEFIFGILIELLRHDRFDGDGDAISILNALKKCDVPAAFRNKYSLLWQLLGYRKGLGERVGKEEDQGQRTEADTCIILNLFMVSNVPWMVIAAITFLSERTPHLVPTFEGQLMDLLDSEIDDIVIAVQGVIHLVFVKPQE